MNKALILVDLQKDFMPKGSLAVTGGNEVVAIANRLAKSPRYAKVVATVDKHKPNHKSFASNHPKHKVGDIIEVNGIQQFLWPDHCVENTPGAAFHGKLNEKAIDACFPKGENPEFDSYSGFMDANKELTGLHPYLQENGIREVDIMGLATDYCVKATALDALALGYKVNLLWFGCRAVNINKEDEHEAVREVVEAGGILVINEEFLC